MSYEIDHENVERISDRLNSARDIFLKELEDISDEDFRKFEADCLRLNTDGLVMYNKTKKDIERNKKISKDGTIMRAVRMLRTNGWKG